MKFLESDPYADTRRTAALAIVKLGARENAVCMQAPQADTTDDAHEKVRDMAMRGLDVFGKF